MVQRDDPMLIAELKTQFFKALCLDDDAEEAYRIYTLTFTEYCASLPEDQEQKDRGRGEKGRVLQRKSELWMHLAQYIEKTKKWANDSFFMSCLCPCFVSSDASFTGNGNDTNVTTAVTSVLDNQTIVLSQNHGGNDNRSSNSNNKVSKQKTCQYAEDEKVDVEQQHYQQKMDHEMNEVGIGILEEALHPSIPVRIVVKKRDDLSSIFSNLSKSMSSLMSRRPLPDQQNDHSKTSSNNPGLTTPLHEAARLGSLKLIERMLSNGGDVSCTNSMRRTALHYVCGGLVKEEEDGLNFLHYSMMSESDGSPKAVQSSAGIRSDRRQGLIEGYEDAKLKNASKNKNRTNSSNPSPTLFQNIDPSLVEKLKKNRMTCVLSLLTHGTNENSINRVDQYGRTALHYAAELGRSNVCSAILSNTDAILTVIDDSGRTPCELAAFNFHHKLAASLEARAVLIEDENGVHSSSGKIENSGVKVSELSPPFCWFVSKSLSDIPRERDFRIRSTSDELSRFLFREFDVVSAAYQHRNEQDNVTHDQNFDRFLNGVRKLQIKYSSNPSRDVPKYFSEIQVAQLLEHFAWNINLAVKRFKSNPRDVIRDAGLIMKSNSKSPTTPCQCPICLEDIPHKDEVTDVQEIFTLKQCKHSVCTPCLLRYIDSTVKDKLGLRIICPASDCRMLISTQDIETAILMNKDGGTDQDNKNVSSSIWKHECENFVASANDWCFCPHANCQNIVQRIMSSQIVETYDEESTLSLPAVCIGTYEYMEDSNMKLTRTYEGVPYSSNLSCLDKTPPKAHRFCYSCLKNHHWPAHCSDIDAWLNLLASKKAEVGITSDSHESQVNQDLAQQMWLKANTRSCPKCKVPIEKNEGCNHMTCTNRRCKFEFCWICHRPWRLHGKRTGGYFRCNMWQEDGISTADNEAKVNSELEYGTAQYATYAARQASAKMARFLHHFDRYSAHLDSSNLERTMAENVCTRMASVIDASLEIFAQDTSLDQSFHETNAVSSWKGLSFIHAAFVELLECRSVLKNSYIFAFYRFLRSSDISFTIRSRKEKVVFEVIQSDLEMITEHLSDIIGRKHLRATRRQIEFLTSVAAEKRQEFYHFVIRTLRDEKKTVALQTNLLHKLRESHLKAASNNNAYRSNNKNHDNKLIEDALVAHVVQESLIENTNRTGSGQNNTSETAGQTWSCSLCTYDNHVESERCAMCQLYKA